MSLIMVDNLWKIYDIKKQRKGIYGSLHDLIKPEWIKKEAVRGVKFSIDHGESVGYIGSNGSGKSTTLKVLSGILKPTCGTVLIEGIDPFKNRKKYVENIGVVFGQTSQLWWDLSITDTFDLFQHIYKIPKETFNYNLNLMMELLELDKFDSIPVRQLSLGQRMRAEIACAFFHNPKICYLDEPTIGLDIVAKEKIRNFLREINKEKKTTLILTSHDMEDIEQICNRIILIDSGKILYDGLTESFTDAFGKDRVLTIELEHEVPNIFTFYGELLHKEGKKAKFLFEKNKVSATKLIQDLVSRYPVIDCKLDEPKLEHLVRDIYEAK